MAFPRPTALLERLRLVRVDRGDGTPGAAYDPGPGFEPEPYSPSAPGSTVSNANRPRDVTGALARVPRRASWSRWLISLI